MPLTPILIQLLSEASREIEFGETTYPKVYFDTNSGFKAAIVLVSLVHIYDPVVSGHDESEEQKRRPTFFCENLALESWYSLE